MIHMNRRAGGATRNPPQTVGGFHPPYEDSK
jgi:hypothetical protein